MADPGDLTCQEFVELVTEYLEGVISPAERARFTGHLDECDSCAEYLDQMRQIIQTLGHLTEERIAPDARARLLTEFRNWKRTPGTTPTV